MFKKIITLFCFLVPCMSSSYILHTVVVEHPITHQKIVLYGDQHHSTNHAKKQTEEIFVRLSALCESQDYKNGLVKVFFEGFAAHLHYERCKQEGSCIPDHLFLDLYNKNKQENLAFIDVDNRYFIAKIQQIQDKLLDILNKKIDLTDSTRTSIKTEINELKKELELYFEKIKTGAYKSSVLLTIKLASIDALFARLASLLLQTEDAVVTCSSLLTGLMNEAAIGLDFNCIEKLGHYCATSKIIVFAGMNHTLNIQTSLMDMGYTILYDSVSNTTMLKRVVEIRKLYLKDSSLITQDKEALLDLITLEQKLLNQPAQLEELEYIA